MTATERVILHCDLDAFFASVEQLDEPNLRGRPVLVGGRGARGVVAAASYEARAFGCRSAMPMAQAVRRCPEAVVCAPRGKRYAEISAQFMSILESVSPVVQPLSLDEAFVDVTGSNRLLGSGVQIAESIRTRTREELGLVVSIGVAPNKFTAKIGSDLEKPNGLVVIETTGIACRLAPLPIERMWGIGPKSLVRFHRAGLRTFGDLQASTPEALARRFGKASARFFELAHGRDDRPVQTERGASSISQECTFPQDIGDRDQLEGVLLGQVSEVAHRLRRIGARAGSIGLKIRDGDFVTISRSRTLREPSDMTQVLWDGARELFSTWASAQFRALRLLGFAVRDLTHDKQAVLFEDVQDKRQRSLDATTDAIRERFGARAIKRGRSVS